MKPDEADLRAVIAKNIDYDGSILHDEIICPHCKGVVQQKELYYWLAHQSTLISAIAKHLGWRCHEKLAEVLEGYSVTGSPSEDATVLAAAIIEELYI